MGESPTPPSIDDQNKANAITKKWRFRTALAGTGIVVAVCTCILFRQKIYPYWNDVLVVNFFAAWIPFVLSILLAFVPEHEMTKSKKIIWRCGVIGAGFIWSALLWHQQVVADKAAKEDQERIVTKAVFESNQHSDQQIGNVRDDVKSVKGDVREVKGNLVSTTHDIRNALSKSGIDISKSIEEMNKPVPSELAKLEFSFFSPFERVPPFSTTSLDPDKDGNFPVEFTFINTSNVTAEDIDIWLELCTSCSFVTEPAGFDRPTGLTEQVRHLIVHALNPGVAMQKISFLMKPGGPITTTNYFVVAFTYSCKTCGKKQPAQIAKVYGRP